MKSLIIGINASALALLATLLLIGSFHNDTRVQGLLADLDRAEGINEAKFSKHYRGAFDGVRDQRFAHFLGSPWIEYFNAAILIGAGLAATNIAITVSKRKPEQEKHL